MMMMIMIEKGEHLFLGKHVSCFLTYKKMAVPAKIILNFYFLNIRIIITYLHLLVECFVCLLFFVCIGCCFCLVYFFWWGWGERGNQL